MARTLPATPDQALRTLRVIGLALAAGVTMFAAVAWYIRQETPPAPADSPLLLYLWIIVATTLLAAAMVVWRGRVVPVIEDGPGAGGGVAPGQGWQDRAARLQTGLVIVWALAEAAALFGVVVYFLQGHALAAGLGVAIIWGAVALSWPRREWLGGE